MRRDQCSAGDNGESVLYMCVCVEGYVARIHGHGRGHGYDMEILTK